MDGRHFFDYGQYDTVEDFGAIFESPETAAAFGEFPRHGFVPELHTYEVVLVDTP